MQSTVYGEMQGILHSKHQQDVLESPLKILDILHNHTKIDHFPGLAFSQEAMKCSSIKSHTNQKVIIQQPLITTI